MWWFLLIGYALIVVLIAVFQRRLIYVPTRLSPTMAEQEAKQGGLSAWHNAAGQFIGWKLPANGESQGSVLLTHGNAGSATGRGYIINSLHAALPLDVYVLEYPGYGARPGDPSLNSVLAATEEGFATLPSDKPVFVISESLGTGAAAHLARLHPQKIKGMVMFVPYADLAGVAQNSMPFVPAVLLLRDRYRPALWMRDYRGPVKVVLAGADAVIPMKFGQRLYDSYAGPKQLQLVPNAGHGDVMEQSPEWWRDVFIFWNSPAK